jgi:predicted peroxiredoxin
MDSSYKLTKKGKGKKMTEKQEKIIYICTVGPENSEKAHIPIALANAALAMDVQAMIVLQGNGVYLGTKGYLEHVPPGGGFPHIKDMMADFLELGGQLKVCSPCIKERNIDVSELIEGAEIMAAAELNINAIEADALFIY